MRFKRAGKLSGEFFIMGCEFHGSKVVALSLLDRLSWHQTFAYCHLLNMWHRAEKYQPEEYGC
ncbi:hypothetical protein CRX50_26190 [Escherichia coli]|nr:hypothetical protein CRX50_00715 [Escherichia coli]PHG89411.1 hypothetical protein CRX50_26190 [Escherichia coli]